MKNFVFFIIVMFCKMSYAQIANESNIPFLLDSDGDTIVNVIDTDDDNDGVLDNADAFPLDPSRSAPAISTITTITSADAGCRNNGANGGKNFGIETSSDLNNSSTRYQILKFTKPLLTNLISATLTIYTNTENDPLQIYSQADNSWIEGTLNGGASNGTTGGVTFTGNNTNFTNKILVGTTAAPTGGKYTFNIPVNMLPSSGDFTLIILDPSNDGNIESIFTREVAGKGATIDYNFYTTISPRLNVSPTAPQTTYLAGRSFTIDFKLASAPSGTVYIPLDLSDNTKASIAGGNVLVFDPSNWNTIQTKTITPLAVGQFDVAIRPLHSIDNFFNGFNNADLLGFTIQATDVTNLGPWTIATGNTFTTTLNTVSAVGSNTFKYKLLNAPVGMSIVENTGLISFTPLSHQTGSWPVEIEVIDDKGNKSKFTTTIVVTNSGIPDPVGIYVIPYAPNNGNGTPANPYNNISVAVNAAAAAGGGNVYVRGGEYELLDIQNIGAVGTASNPIIIQPAVGESVKFNFGKKSNGFEFLQSSRHITFKNFEIDGGTDNVDFWCLPALAFWGDESIYRGGGIAIGVNGENITIEGNYIHNCYQKAVEIRTARYLKVYNNIIHSIATTSLSGGHGIMRQQSSGPITTPDNGVDFRWDLMNNLIFNVEQRIYSWVPSKGYIDMVLDEGKPILIDDVSDPDPIPSTMKARIMNNIVAYGSIDQIRLKSTNNLTVTNNTVYSASPSADGITDKIADPGNVGLFTNTIFTNNAVQTMPGTTAIELTDIIRQGLATGLPPTISGNYAAVGQVLPTGVIGVSTTASALFVNPDNGNFRLNPALGLPSTLGVPNNIMDDIDTKVAKFGVSVKWDKWQNDHLKLTQTILDNIPGVNDGIPGNDTVFTDYGTLHLNGADRGEIEFNVVNGAWKTKTGSPSKQHFELNAAYEAWYEARNAATKNVLGGDYNRIRWGNSIVKQNQVFRNEDLTNSQITADTNTIIYSKNNHFTLDGDLLIDFEGVTPVPGQKWNLMQAASISTANTGQLFDRVLFEGASLTPSQYSLTIVDVPGGKAVQLQILSIALPIQLLEFGLVPLANGNVQLNWKTSSEENSKYFEVEKSNNSISWTSFARINAAGTSLSSHSYSIIDQNPYSGANYYRLKQIDVDGKATYSKVLKIVLKNKYELSVFPNPVINELNVKGLPYTSIVRVVITDCQGHQIHTTSNLPQFPIDVSKFAQGMYIIHVYDDKSNVLTDKFVKVN